MTSCPASPRRLASGLALVAFALAAAPAAASPILTRHFETQEAFADYLAKRGLDARSDMLLMAQGRAGDSRIGGAWELGLFGVNGIKDAKAEGTAQLDWRKQQDETSWAPISLSRFGETLAFTIGSATTTLALPKGEAISALAFSAIAETKDGRAILRDLVLDGTKLEEVEVRAEDGARDLALVEGLSGDFTLTGEARLRWDDDSLPKDPSALMVQIAGYDLSGDMLVLPVATPPSGLAGMEASEQASAIPAPGVALLVLAASLGLIGHRHLRRRGGENDGSAGTPSRDRDGSGGRI